MKSSRKAKEDMVVRGWNLSKANVMWLTNVANEQTKARADGKTTSASEVLNGMLTKAREAYEVSEKKGRAG